MNARMLGFGVALLAVVSLSPPAGALPLGDANCRKALGAGVKGVMGVVLKEQTKCFKSVMAGTLPGVNCNDVHDPAFPGALKVTAAGNKASKLAAKGCIAAQSPQINGYVFCPSPCGSITISGYSDVAACLVCVAEAEASTAENTAYTTPPPAPLTDVATCQTRVGQAMQKYSSKKAKVQQACQYSEDVTPLGANCRIADPKLQVAKALLKLKTSIANCSDAELAALNSCGNNVSAEQSCIQGAADLMLDDLFTDVYTPAGANAVFVSASVGTPGG